MAKAAPIHGIDPLAPLLANAARMILARLDEMLAYERYIDIVEETHELHQMRIAAKRLRYTMEIFEEIYARYTPDGKAFSAAISVVKGLQETLGEIHDADVLAPQLTRQLARLLKAGYGKDEQGLPLIGVHLVDFTAAAGLLTLCRQTRADRDRYFKQLGSTWRRLKQERTFENLRALLQAALAAATPAQALHELAAELQPATKTRKRITHLQDAAHGQETKSSDTPASGSSRRSRKSTR